MSKEQTKRYTTVGLGYEFKEALDKIAREEYRTISNVVRLLLCEALKARELKREPNEA